MKILVTGGAGYIGSHTCVELMNAGYEAVVVDNLVNSSEKSIARIGEITGKTPIFYKADLRDKEALRSVFRENDIAAVIHFAGLKAVGESVEKPIMYYENNIDSTLCLIKVMEEFSCKKIVFSSSATVYGNPERIPVDETFPTTGVSPYGKTKLFIEHILSDLYAADNSWSIVLLRYFNPIGAHQSGLIGEDPKGIPNNLMPYISRVAIGALERLHVFGNDYNTIDGTGVRDYIHVCDLALGHVGAVGFALENSGCEAVNLGTGKGTSVLELVEAFKTSTGVDVPYVIEKRRAGDIDAIYADTKKAARLFGFKAKYTIEDMCKDTWRFQQKNPNGYN